MCSFAHSPFNNKAGSFFAPNEVEIAHIRALLVTPIAESAKLESEIAEMEATLAELKARRDALNAGIATHQSLIAPIRRISQHVLEEIFLACLPTAHNAVIDPSEAPLLLGRVCRYWRELAYTMPTLWNRIHIAALEDSAGSWSYNGWDPGYVASTSARAAASPSDYTEFSTTLDSWLSRSASAPLDISYYEPSDPRRPPSPVQFSHSAPPSTYAFLLPLMQKVSHRLRSIELQADINDWASILSMHSSKLPALRRLRLAEWAVEEPLACALPVLAHPDLEYLDLQCLTTPRDLPCAWANLVELRLYCAAGWTEDAISIQGGLSVMGAYELLLQCSRLRTCWLEINAMARFIPSGSRSLDLLHLEELSLGVYLSHADEPSESRDSHTWAVPHFFHVLNAPKLRFLDLGRAFPLESIRPAQSQSELVVVSFLSSTLPSESHIGILHALPQTTTLHAYVADSTPQIGIPTDNFFPRIGDENLCPLLRDFRIIVVKPNVGQTGLVPLLRARLQEGLPISLSVTVTTPPGNEPIQRLDVEDELRELEQHGLKLKVDYPTPQPLMELAPSELQQQQIRRWKYRPRDGLPVPF
ncbi:F-box domain-containing protein [Mycena kentingensis (nom. inval.)]|nr:F-box domain-containing protein [Mycena kentingensis (nom. inval.)]